MESIDDIIERVKKDFNVTPKNPKSLDDMNREAYLGDPNCPICHGIGFVTGDYPIDDPRFGKMDVCSCRKAKLEEETRNQLIRESNLYRLCRYEFWKLSMSKDAGSCGRMCGCVVLKLAFDHAQKFAKERNGWLLLTGKIRNGGKPIWRLRFPMRR
jgi:DNA replication protein DnaC